MKLFYCQVNWMVDRNLQVSYLIVDEMHHEHPELLKDQYWDEVFPNELPYTIASERFREEHPEPSTAKIEVSKTAAMPTVMSSVRIDDMVGNQTESNPGSPTTVQAVHYKFPNQDEEVRIKLAMSMEISKTHNWNWPIQIRTYSRYICAFQKKSSLFFVPSFHPKQNNQQKTSILSHLTGICTPQ